MFGRRLVPANKCLCGDVNPDIEAKTIEAIMEVVNRADWDTELEISRLVRDLADAMYDEGSDDDWNAAAAQMD